MPVELLDLPEEILHACIGELLPLLRENGPDSWIVDYSLKTFPTDILNLRLACHLLYHLATPWMWRKLDIHLDRCIFACKRPSYDYPIVLHKWTSLLDQPEVAKHVRFFSLSGSLIPDNGLRPALAALIPFVRMMNNLRVVRLKVDPIPNATETGEIFSTLFAGLLSKPELHTFILLCALSLPSLILRCVLSLPSGLGSLVNVKRLTVSAYWLAKILPITPHLEVLSVFGFLDNDSNASSFPIPWNTLRELDARDVNWTHFLDNYIAWKERNPTEYSPLSELFFSEFALDVDMIRRTLAVFSEQRLTKFKLAQAHYVDLAILRSVLATFPLLEDLNLFTSTFDVNWETDLSDISEIFGKCPALKDFRVSYTERIFIPYSDEEEGIIEGLPTTLMSKFAKVVASLGKNTRSLNRVQFFNWYDESYPFEIERDGRGEYKTSHFSQDPSDLILVEALRTSGWRLENFAEL